MSSFATATGGSLVKPWDSFNGVASGPPSKWYVVGTSGVVLTSVDNGRTWTRRKLAPRGPGSWLDLFSVSFTVDGSNGWIGGERGVLLHTMDAGASWQEQHSGTSQNILQIVAISPEYACAVGTNGTILNTTDGGKTWHSHRLKIGVNLFDLYLTGKIGWAVGEFQTLIYSANSCEDWQIRTGAKRSDFASTPYFGVYFIDDRHGWLSAQGGRAFWTSDGAHTWTQIALPSSASIFAISGAVMDAGGVPTELWLAGENGTLEMIPLSQGRPLVSVTPRLLHPSFYSLTALRFSGPIGFAVGTEGTILRTDDSGRSWKELRP